MKFTRLVSYLAFAALLLLPAFASAAPGLMDPPDSDISRQLVIKQLFGPLDGGGASPFGDMFKIFNSAVLAIGGILVMYTLIAGTMSTAHDGEMLGKRWSSLWVPVRTSIGAAAIMPVLPGGFCVAQALVIWLAVQGIGLADSLTMTFLESQTSTMASNAMSGAALRSSITDVVKNLLVNSTCAHGLNQSSMADRKDLGRALTTDKVLPTVTVAAASATGATYEWFGGDCGSASIEFAAPAAGQPQFDPGGTISDSLFNESETNLFVDMDAVQRSLSDVHRQQFLNAISKMDALANQIAVNVANGSNGDELKDTVKQQILDTSNTWATAIETEMKAKSAGFTNTKLLEAIKHDGWFVLGSWYIQISKAQNSLFEAATKVPSVNRPDALYSAIRKQDEPGMSWSKITAFFGFGSGGLATRLQVPAPQIITAGYRLGLGTLANSDSPGAVKASGAGIPTSMNEVGNAGSSAFLRAMNIQANDRQELVRDPVIFASNYGFVLMNAGMTMAGIAATIEIAAAALSNAAEMAGLGVAQAIGQMIMPIASSAVVSGTVLAYYLPMVPFILWIGAIFGWVVLVVEGVIAAPLWAVTHLAPDGDGVVGRGGQGYMLVLSLTLRPALMVFGFAAAVVVMRPMGLFLNSTFFATFFASTLSNGLASVIGVVVCAIIYFVLMVSVVNRVFSLIHHVPDGILRWIGGGGNEIGAHAGAVESHSAAKTMAAGTAIGAVNQGFQAVGNSAGRARQATDNKDRRHINEEQDNAGKLADGKRSADAALDSAAQRYAQTGSADDLASMNQAQAASNDASLSAAEGNARVAVAQGQAFSASDQQKARGKEAEAFLDRAAAARAGGNEGIKNFLQSGGTGAFGADGGRVNLAQQMQGDMATQRMRAAANEQSQNRQRSLDGADAAEAQAFSSWAAAPGSSTMMNSLERNTATASNARFAEMKSLAGSIQPDRPDPTQPADHRQTAAIAAMQKFESVATMGVDAANNLAKEVSEAFNGTPLGDVATKEVNAQAQLADARKEHADAKKGSRS